MSPLRILLRCLLIVMFCLEGSLSLWASSAMAVDSAALDVAAKQSPATATGKACEEDGSRGDETAQGEGGSSHHDCDCGTGAGCCACVFPVLAITHALPFAAQHRLATQLAVPSRSPVVLTATTAVFRPPIG